MQVQISVELKTGFSLLFFSSFVFICCKHQHHWTALWISNTGCGCGCRNRCTEYVLYYIDVLQYMHNPMVCWPVFRWRVKTRSVCVHTQPLHLLTCFRWRVKTRRKMKTSNRRSMMGCWLSQRVTFCPSWPDWWGGPPSLLSSPPSSQTCSNDWLVSALTSRTGVVSFFASVSVCCITRRFDSVLISCCSEQTYNKIKTNQKLRVLSLPERCLFFKICIAVWSNFFFCCVNLWLFYQIQTLNCCWGYLGHFLSVFNVLLTKQLLHHIHLMS